MVPNSWHQVICHFVDKTLQYDTNRRIMLPLLHTPGQIDGGVNDEAEARLVLVGCVPADSMDGNVWIGQRQGVLLLPILDP